MNNIIKKIKENIVFNNEFATVYNDKVEFPNGSKGNFVVFSWNVPYGVAILPITEDEKVILIKEYVYSKKKWRIHIPKGMGEDNILPINKAKEELKEETGFEGDNWKLMFISEETVITEQGTYFYSTNIDLLSKEKFITDGKEAIEGYMLCSKDDVKNMIKNNEIQDMATQLALFYWLKSL